MSNANRRKGKFTPYDGEPTGATCSEVIDRAKIAKNEYKRLFPWGGTFAEKWQAEKVLRAAGFQLKGCTYYLGKKRAQIYTTINNIIGTDGYAKRTTYTGAHIGYWLT